MPTRRTCIGRPSRFRAAWRASASCRHRPTVRPAPSARCGYRRHAVVKLDAATTDLEGEARNRLAIHAGQPDGGTHGHALGEGGEDFNLLVAGEVVHNGLDPSC